VLITIPTIDHKSLLWYNQHNKGEKSMEERQCPVCNRTYLADPKRLKWGRQTTCSRACSYKLRVASRKTSEVLICAVCGTEFERSPSNTKGKHGSQFCSSACHYKGRSLGFSKRVVNKPYVVTEQGRKGWLVGAQKTKAKRMTKGNYRKTAAQRAKLSIATTKSLAGGKPYIVSKLEHKVAAELKTLGASFTAQYAFRDPLGRFACLVDFYFPELNAVLEVNGTYWHVDPRVYPEPINDTQRRCLAKYERKIKLLGDLGVRVVEVWEQDLNQGTPQAVLEAYLKLTKG
jgi:G:T-mismatch repair DNA endonuclease (very short patch repair protein)/uncharacterized protein YbaR (Trm112 family)